MLQLDHPWNKKAQPLVWGGLLSLVLLLVAYLLVAYDVLSGSLLGVALLGLAAIQALCQILFFFQIGIGKETSWSKILLVFALFTVFLVVGGSIWIMANLDYNTMPKM